MIELCFQDILDSTGAVLQRGDVRSTVRGVSTDSRTIAPGEVFLALEGPNYDGNRFALDALRRGAAGLLLRGTLADASALALGTTTVPVAVHASPRRALAELAAWHRATPRHPRRRDHRLLRQDHNQEHPGRAPARAPRGRRKPGLLQQRNRRAAHALARRVLDRGPGGGAWHEPSGRDRFAVPHRTADLGHPHEHRRFAPGGAGLDRGGGAGEGRARRLPSARRFPGPRRGLGLHSRAAGFDGRARPDLQHRRNGRPRRARPVVRVGDDALPPQWTARGGAPHARGAQRAEPARRAGGVHARSGSSSSRCCPP